MPSTICSSASTVRINFRTCLSICNGIGLAYRSTLAVKLLADIIQIMTRTISFVALAIEGISRLKSEANDLQMYLNGHVFIHDTGLDEAYHDHEHNYRLRKLEESIQRVFQPAFHVDVTNDQLYRNVGQYYASLKPTKHFCNADTIRELKERLIEQTRKVLLIKGKQAIESFDDLLLVFTDL